MLNGQLIERPLTFHTGEIAELELEQISSAHLDTLNALYRAQPWPLSVGEQNLLIKADWTTGRAEPSDPWTVFLSAEDHTIELVAPRSVLQQVLDTLDPELTLSELSDELRILLFELALQQALEQLEERFRTSLTIHSIFEGERADAYDAPIEVPLRISFGTQPAARSLLRLPSVILEQFDFAMHADHKSGHGRHPVDVSLHACVVWGMVELAVDALRNLSPGDIILPDETGKDPDAAMLVVADQLVAEVKRKEGGYRLLGSPRAAEANNGWALADDRSAAGFSDIHVKDATVRLLFELGRSEIDRKTAGSAKSGDVVRIPSSSNGSVYLVVGGRRIGRGELTQIGDTTGVRVTRL